MAPYPHENDGGSCWAIGSQQGEGAHVAAGQQQTGTLDSLLVELLGKRSWK